MNDEKTRLRDIVERWLRGSSPEQIAVELGLDREGVADAIGRLDAVLVLLAHDFPERLISSAARIAQDDAKACMDAIRNRAQTTEQLRALSAARGLEQDAAKTAFTPATAASHEPDSEAAQALDVLDFWASKWL